ncbi:hypothetical protein PF003_g19027 [Phytophthora fragariae]|nr:hypothetical protein PF003_g19027 [Phytophthora fragariae]
MHRHIIGKRTICSFFLFRLPLSTKRVSRPWRTLSGAALSDMVRCARRLRDGAGFSGRGRLADAFTVGHVMTYRKNTAVYV